MVVCVGGGGGGGGTCVCVCVCTYMYVCLVCGARSLTEWWSLDEMGKRVEDLEKNIRDLMEQVDTKEDLTGTEPPSRK